MTTTSTMTDKDRICLRRGYQCKCDQCQPWIARWSKEIDAFSCVDTMMREGKCLLQIYERLTAEYPYILQLHSDFFERQYFEYKYDNSERETKRPRIKLKNPPPPPGSPPAPPLLE